MDADTTRKRVLVLYWAHDPSALRVAIAHHLRALDYVPGGVHAIYVNTHDDPPRWLRRLKPDAVILHTTFLCMRWSHLFPTWKWGYRWIAELDCQKIAMPQDEYDHSEVLDEWLVELGVSTIMSNFDASHRGTLYPLMQSRARFEHAFTGYVDLASVDELDVIGVKPIERRATDIVYRATHLPYWFGSQGQLKHRIGDEVVRQAEAFGLETDISTVPEDTILGPAWLEFLASAKCVIGCESGSSVLDRRGEIRARIRHLLRASPDLSFEEIDAAMWPGWDSYAFFALSPRHFEAMTTQTCQLLVEGHYDGVLQAGRHYISIRRDFSNLDDVLGAVRDTARLTEIAATAYTEIVEDPRFSYGEFARSLELLLSEGPRVPSRFRPGWAPAGRALAAREVLAPYRPKVAQRVFSAPRSAWIRGVVALRMARNQPALGSLVSLFRSLEPRPPGIGWSGLLADILRLGLIGLAQAAKNDGRKFVVDASFDRGGTALVLRSLPMERLSEAETIVLGPEDVLQLRRVVWDHRPVDVFVPYALTRWRWISVAIGDAGQYEFRTLLRLGQADADSVAKALNAVLARTESRDPSLARKIARHPLLYTRLLTRVSRLGRGLPRRAILSRPVGGANSLARDLLRAEILRRLCSSPGPGFFVVLSYDAASGTLLAESRTGVPDTDNHRVVARGEIRRLVWDHSAVGTSVSLLAGDPGSPPVKLGADGRYWFSGLESMAERYPRPMSRFFRSTVAQSEE